MTASANVFQLIIPKKIKAMSDTMSKAESLAQELRNASGKWRGVVSEISTEFTKA